MKNVLAFFGAFNPPTKAHIDLAEFAMKQTNCEEVIFVPSKSEYIIEKQNKNFAFSDDERIYMLDKLINNHPWIRVTNHDIMAETQPRSYETLCWLRNAFHIHLSLLIGADQLFNMEEHWTHVHEIAKEFGIVCLSRQTFSTEAILQHPFWKDIAQYVQVIETPKNTRWISSSNVRRYIQTIQQMDRYLQNEVPKEVYDYLKENHL